MANVVKITMLLKPADLFFPLSCEGCGRLGEVLCECCKNDILFEHEDFCLNCRSEFDAAQSSVFASRERDAQFCQVCGFPKTFAVGMRGGLVGKLVHDYKYESRRALSKPLAELLDGVVPYFDGKVVVVPMPTIRKHIFQRGFDHTLLLAKKFARIRGYRVASIIRRARNTVQVGADAGTRKAQARSAYKISPVAKIDPEAIYLLVDDVWTTGATMRAGMKVLREAGAERILGAVVAVNKR